jgi:hypothetical protein
MDSSRSTASGEGGGGGGGGAAGEADSRRSAVPPQTADAAINNKASTTQRGESQAATTPALPLAKITEAAPTRQASQAMFVQLAVKRRPAQAQQPGGLADVALGLRECSAHRRSLA